MMPRESGNFRYLQLINYLITHDFNIIISIV